MTDLLLLRMKSPADREVLVEDVTEYPTSPLLTPCQEREVYATLVEPPVPTNARRVVADALLEHRLLAYRAAVTAAPNYNPEVHGAALERQETDARASSRAYDLEAAGAVLEALAGIGVRP